jgi:Uma2 family endonuclease
MSSAAVALNERQEGGPNLELLSELLQQEPLPDGTLPERRLTFGGHTWRRYLDFDRARGENGTSPRLNYADGVIELMTTSQEHERIKKWIDKLLDVYLEKSGLEEMVSFRGEATLQNPLAEAAAEPDESWCIGGEKEYPDLVLEIALSSGGLEKLELYRQFAVPEIWIWRSGRLEAYALRPDKTAYEPIEQSVLLPGLDLRLLERCVLIQPWPEAKRAFRAGLGSVSPNSG